MQQNQGVITGLFFGTGEQVYPKANFGIMHAALEAHLGKKLIIDDQAEGNESDTIPRTNCTQKYDELIVSPTVPNELLSINNPKFSYPGYLIQDQNLLIMNGMSPSGVANAVRPDKIAAEFNAKRDLAADKLWEQIQAKLDKGEPAKIFLQGYSRGACLSLAVANELQRIFDVYCKEKGITGDQAKGLLNMELFLIDPVPGETLGIFESRENIRFSNDLKIIPRNVSCASIFVAEHEYRFGYSNLNRFIRKNKDTELDFNPVPGHHNDVKVDSPSDSNDEISVTPARFITSKLKARMGEFYGNSGQWKIDVFAKVKKEDESGNVRQVYERQASDVINEVVEVSDGKQYELEGRKYAKEKMPFSRIKRRHFLIERDCVYIPQLMFDLTVGINQIRNENVEQSEALRNYLLALKELYKHAILYKPGSNTGVIMEGLYECLEALNTYLSKTSEINSTYNSDGFKRKPKRVMDGHIKNFKHASQQALNKIAQDARHRHPVLKALKALSLIVLAPGTMFLSLFSLRNATKTETRVRSELAAKALHKIKAPVFTSTPKSR